MFEFRNEELRKVALTLYPPEQVDRIMENLIDRLDRRAAAASKVCITCKIAKPLKEFGRDIEQLSALRKRCLRCEAELSAAYYKSRKEAAA